MDATVHIEYCYCKEKITFASLFIYSSPAFLSREPAASCRSCRRFQRNLGWWNTVWNTYSEKRFKQTLRVSRGTFQFILNRIRHDLERDVVCEDPIPPGHPKTQTMQTADCRLQTVQTMQTAQTMQTKYFFLKLDSLFSVLQLQNSV